MNDRRLMAFAAAIVAVIIAGEAYIYCNDWDGMYDVRFAGSSVTIEANSSIVYDIVSIDNGGDGRPSETVLYYDRSYGERLDETHHATGGTYLSQEYYISQLRIQLGCRGTDAVTMGAEELREMMMSSVAAGKCDQSVVMVSGAIPDTVYSGLESDLIVQWIDMGGRVYWAGGIIGQYCSSSDGTVRDLGADRQSLFLGAVCQNPEEAYGLEETDPDWKDALCLAGNGTTYAVNPADVASALPMGFTDGTYSSVCLIGHGSGMICILGGVLSNDQRSDMAQIISSGTTDTSILVDHVRGSVTRTAVTETMDVGDSPGNIMIYAYLGGYFTVYGRGTALRRGRQQSNRQISQEEGRRWAGCSEPTACAE